MTDRIAFLHAIARRPDDDLPRLIFADWLDEHGEPDRAEFIRLQCLATPTDADSRRIEELETMHRAAWVEPLAGTFFRAEFRRGFVDHAVLPAATFLKHGADLRRQTPLRGVTLLGVRRVLPDLLRGPLLAGLAALHLTGGRLGDDGARLLANSAALKGLTTLRLGDNVISDAGVTALARSPHLAGLTSLVLRDNAVGDGGAWELANALHMDRLTRLDLAGNEIGESGLRALRSTTGITDLDVSDQRPPVGRRRRALVSMM